MEKQQTTPQQQKQQNKNLYVCVVVFLVIIFQYCVVVLYIVVQLFLIQKQQSHSFNLKPLLLVYNVQYIILCCMLYLCIITIEIIFILLFDDVGCWMFVLKFIFSHQLLRIFYITTGINTVFAACCLLAFFCFLLLVFNIFNNI